MFKSDDPVMWRHGAFGLWKIGSKTATDKMLAQIEINRTNADFVSWAEQMVLQDSNQWTKPVLQALNRK
jgi:hypothetical protein